MMLLGQVGVARSKRLRGATSYEKSIDDKLSNTLSNFDFVLAPNMMHVYIFLR